MSATRTANRDARPLIETRIPFVNHGSNFVGNAYPDGYGTRHTGRLPEEWVKAIQRENPTYVVFSYATPIGWWSQTHGWTVPGESYSVTTDSKHRPHLSGLDQRGAS